MIEEKKHAKFSASGSYRWLACPGSIKLSEGVPDQEESEYAKEGTRAHEALEYLLRNRKSGVKAHAQLAKKYPADMIAHAAESAREIESRLVNAEGAELLCESKVSLEHIEPDMFGTLDAAIVELFGTLEVIDFKYGAGVPVSPKNNSQMIFYALAVAHQYDYNFDRVKLTILQPRIGDGAPQSWEISIDRLQAWNKIFSDGVKAAKEAGQRKSTGYLVSGDHCRWCPAKAKCPEISERSFKEAQIDFQPVKDELKLPKITTQLQPAFIGKVLNHADAIETWLGEIRAQAYSLLQRGNRVPGWKLVDKRASRKWIDAEKVEKEARKTFGDIAFETSLRSPAQMEKLAADAKPWVAKRCALVSSGQTIAKESDERTLTDQAALDFSPVTDEPTVKKITKKKRR